LINQRETLGELLSKTESLLHKRENWGKEHQWDMQGKMGFLVKGGKRYHFFKANGGRSRPEVKRRKRKGSVGDREKFQIEKNP